MKNKRCFTSPESYVNLSSKVFFLICIIFSIATTYHVTGHFLDSDTSSELVLASHLIETGKILSPDWFYATELRFLHVQLIYIPLMLLIDDWFWIRYLGALIMQLVYIISFGCLVRTVGKSKNFFRFGAALLLLPVSVTYGRIVLYHNHYLPNVTVAFFLVALSMHFVGEVDWRSKKTWLWLWLLAALSFAAGMNSIRQLMITHAPLLLISIVFCWMDDAKDKDHSRSAFLKPVNLNLLFCSVYATVFSFFGLIFQGILCSRLGINLDSQSETNLLSFIGFDNIPDILYGFFHQFGYRKNIPMLSVSGILALGGIFTGCFLIYISVMRIRQNRASNNKRTTLLSLFFLFHTIVMIIVFLLTRNTETKYYYPLYLSLCYPWAVPLVLLNLEELPPKIHTLRTKKLFAFISVSMLLLSSAFNLLYFQEASCSPQTYEGLGFQNKDKKAELTEAVDFLMAHGYDKGYANHWEGNIVTEMTNGNIPMVIIDDQDLGTYGNLKYRDWLSYPWLRESPCEKPFLLLTEAALHIFQKSDCYTYCTLIYSGHNHVAYSIDNLEAFVNTLYY